MLSAKIQSWLIWRKFTKIRCTANVHPSQHIILLNMINSPCHNILWKSVLSVLFVSNTVRIMFTWMNCLEVCVCVCFLTAIHCMHTHYINTARHCDENTRVMFWQKGRCKTVRYFALIGVIIIIINRQIVHISVCWATLIIKILLNVLGDSLFWVFLNQICWEIIHEYHPLSHFRGLIITPSTLGTLCSVLRI